MNRIGIVAAAGLAAGAVWLACWRLAGSVPWPVPGELLTQAATTTVEANDRFHSLEVREPGPAAAEELSSDPRPRVGTERARTPVAVPPGKGTAILVVDSRDEEPIERFALRIWKGDRERDEDGELLDGAPVKKFPEGVLFVEIPLEGFRFSIGAPDYLPLTGMIEPISSTDRRAFIRLDREARVRGRVLFEGKPVPGVPVRLKGGRREEPEDGEDLGAWYDHPSVPRYTVTQADWADEEGFFDIGGLPPGGVELSIWTDERLHFKRELEALEAGQTLDLGDLELTRKPERQEKILHLGTGRQGGERASTGSGESTRTIFSGQVISRERTGRGPSSLDRVVRTADATVRVQAFDGERPLPGVTVLTQRSGRQTLKEVGVTDEAGEAAFELNPADPTHLVLRLGSQLPLGRTETPVTSALGRETIVPIVLTCGALDLELPDTFTPSTDTALLLQFESETLPAPGFVIVTLRGDPGELEREGIDWKGNRCELPALAAGSYRIELDVMKGAGEGSRSRLLRPTELRFEGEALVVAGERATCALTQR